MKRIGIVTARSRAVRVGGGSPPGVTSPPVAAGALDFSKAGQSGLLALLEDA